MTARGVCEAFLSVRRIYNPCLGGDFRQHTGSAGRFFCVGDSGRAFCDGVGGFVGREAAADCEDVSL